MIGERKVIVGKNQPGAGLVVPEYAPVSRGLNGSLRTKVCSPGETPTFSASFSAPRGWA